MEPVPGLSQDDWKLKRDIDGELRWSPFVDADNVTVTVRDGVAYSMKKPSLTSRVIFICRLYSHEE